MMLYTIHDGSNYEQQKAGNIAKERTHSEN